MVSGRAEHLPKEKLAHRGGGELLTRRGAAYVADSVDLSILMVSYNTSKLTVASLRSVIEQTADISYEIIVVDNASEDDSVAAIESKYPGVKLIRLSDNVGFATANNLAAAEARGKQILLLNPDTLILDGAIQKLVRFSERRPEAGIWGGRTYLDAGLDTLNLGSCWALPSPWSLLCEAIGFNALFSGSALFNSEHYGLWKRDTEREVGMVAGCFLLINRELWNQLGGFDPRFFMYFEDTDLNIRARKLGHRPAITPEATIVHLGGASEPQQGTKLERLYASKARLLQIHWSPVARRFGMALLVLRPLVRCLVYSAASWVWPTAFNGRAQAWQYVWQRRSKWMAA